MLDRGIMQLGNYRIIRSLGRGGFAEVYLGEHIHLLTHAAIKILRISSQLTEQDVKKFREEAQLIAGLEHPHIVKVLDFGIEDNIPFLVMDFAPGGTLRQRYPAGTTLPFTDIIAYVKQVSSALQYAHNRKLIHRDVKPANMLIASNDELLLSDFGIAVTAHSTESQVAEDVIGTWAYMAPEQIQSNPRPASDQYSLGIVVYEWICGCRPFNGSREALLMQHLSTPPPPLHDKIPFIYPAIENVVLKALKKNPQERYQTVEAFSEALQEAFLAQEAIIPSSASSTQLKMQSSALSHYEVDALTPFVGTHLCTFNTNYSYWKCPLSWSPDSSLLAAGSGDGYVRIWNVPNKEEVCKYRGHEGVKGLQWALDGKSLFSGGTEGTVQKWDIQTSRKMFTFKGHIASVNALTLAPSGKFVASGSSDGTIIVWNVESGAQYFKYTGHTSDVHAVSWSPHSTLIASADVSKSVQVWDVSKKEEVYTSFYPVSCVAWSPDGSRIGTGKEFRSIEIWEPYTGNSISSYSFDAENQNSLTGVFAWSSDGTRLACSVNERVNQSNGTFHWLGKKIHIVDVATGQILFIYDGHSNTVAAIVWSPNGKFIASYSSSGEIHLWQAD